MPRFDVKISAFDQLTGEPVDPALIAHHSPGLISYAERHGEFLLAFGGDDDLALLARVCALGEPHLRKSIQAKLEKPDALDKAWGNISSWLRVQLAVSMGIIPEELRPLLNAVGALRNKVLHDTPQGAISEETVAGLLSTLPVEFTPKLDELRSTLVESNRNVAALEPHQRDLQLALLMMYSICFSPAMNLDAAKRAAAEAANVQ